MPRPLAIFLALALASSACGAPPPPANADQVAATDASASRGYRAKVVGDWAASLPPRQARVAALIRHAMADPPDEAAFAGLQPTAQEQEHFRNILRMRREEPGSPLLAELREKLEVLDALRMTITADQVITRTAAGTSIERYQVEAETKSGLVILLEGTSPPEERRWTLTFSDDDHLVLEGSRRVPFHRVGASVPVAPPDAGGPGAAVAAGPGASVPEAPPKTGDAAFDGCVAAYFHCTAQMPPEAQEAMKDSLDLVRVRIRQAASGSAEDRRGFTEVCNRTVNLIRSSGLCR